MKVDEWYGHDVSSPPWLPALQGVVLKKPMVVLQFDEEDYNKLKESRRGIGEFTIAFPHSAIEHLKPPTPCLVNYRKWNSEEMLFGVVSSRSPVTTFDSRLKIKRASQIEPKTIAAIAALLSNTVHRRNFEQRVEGRVSVSVLSSKLSSYLVGCLALIPENQGAMRIASESVVLKTRRRGYAELQSEAIQTALRVFGLDGTEQASNLELVPDRETGLSRLSILEDAVVEHDARSVPGYFLASSDYTGRAVFERGHERLEVFTANKRPLEQVFGVDLIYLNATLGNLVMLQYKMLEPTGHGDYKDWIYRPDESLDKEMKRMKQFSADIISTARQYRFNTSVFYMKFIKREATHRGGGIILPLEHFEQILASPQAEGPRKGIRISYDLLNGRYLRQAAFIDLVRSGYVGSHSATTEHFKVLIDAVLTQGNAAVAAIQHLTEPDYR